MEKEVISKLSKFILILLLFLLLINFLSNSEITGKAIADTECNFFCKLLDAAGIEPAASASKLPRTFYLRLPATGSIDASVQPQLSWSASFRVQSYSLVVATDLSFTNVVHQILLSSGTTSYAPPVNTLSQGVKYYWKVTAINSKGQTLASNAPFFFTTKSSITCTNDCSTSGTRQCSGSGYQTCGNYDADSCLEWSIVTGCSIGQTCDSGQCIAIGIIDNQIPSVTISSPSNNAVFTTSRSEE